MSVHKKAMDSIIDDLDNFESKKMFAGGDPGLDTSEGKGFTIQISMNPGETHGAEKGEEGISGDAGFEDLPADHDIGLCSGGCAMHKGGSVPQPKGEADTFNPPLGEKGVEYKKGEMGMAGGGLVGEPQPFSPGETEDKTLPPFLRKKKAPFAR